MMIINGEFVRDTELDVKNRRLISEGYFGAVPGRNIMIWDQAGLWVGVVTSTEYTWGEGDKPKCVVYIDGLKREYDRSVGWTTHDLD